jgi:hypothetical protein
VAGQSEPARNYVLRVLIVLVLGFEMACGPLRRAPSPHVPPPAPPEEHNGAAYFQSLAEKGGPAAIIDRLYVAPPSIFPSLMAGIASGTPDWLDLYKQLRREADRTGALGTVEQLDDALARGLAANAYGVLRFTRAHPGIPLAAICSRIAPPDDDRAEVLDGRGLLGMVHREQMLERLTDPTVKAARDECLATTHTLVRRQLRIYLVSYGAADATPAARSALTESERRELESVLVAARKDSVLRARLDGRFPDGPFRIAQIPASVLSCCADDQGRIANPEGPWELTDCITDDRLPRARLLNACRITDKVWDITFEKGGFTPRQGRIRARLTGRGWTFAEMAPDRRTLSPSANKADYWVDCRAMSAD